jgi:hypothetical protein
MKRYRALAALPVLVLLLTSSAVPGDEAASGKASEKTPELEIASAVAKKVDQDEAAWWDLTAKLQKAVEAYNPASVHVMPEGQSLEAFRSYCAKLLDSGKNLVALHEKWHKASDGLGDSLRKALSENNLNISGVVVMKWSWTHLLL